MPPAPSWLVMRKCDSVEPITTISHPGIRPTGYHRPCGGLVGRSHGAAARMKLPAPESVVRDEIAPRRPVRSRHDSRRLRRMPLDPHPRAPRLIFLALLACVLPTAATSRAAQEAAAAEAPAQEPPAQGMPETVVPPQVLPRTSGPIEIDGDVSDAAWSTAARFDQFYETSP